MNKRIIFFLENYLGYLICLILNFSRTIFAPRLINKKTTNPPLRKVIFVKLIEQGALVLHRTAFAEAAATYGKKNIYICTLSSNAAVVEILQVFDPANVILLQEKSVLQFAFSYMRALVKTRREKIDAAIDLEFFSRATAILCYLSGAKLRAGYHRYLGNQSYRGDLFTHRLNYSHYEHVSECGIALLQSLKIAPEDLPALDIQVLPERNAFIFPAKQENISRLNVSMQIELSSSSHLIILNQNLNDPLPLRRWTPENYKCVIEGIQLQHPDAHFIFTGRLDEFGLTEEFISMYNVKNGKNLCGQTSLVDLLSLYSIAHLLICSDSGPGHFASLTKIPSIVLFGPETPVLYGPYSDNAHIIYKKIPCSPCYNVYNNRLSPCSNNLCMKKIMPAEVIDLSLRFLN